MKKLRMTLLILIITAAISFAVQYSVTGTVFTSATVPVQGLIVVLENNGNAEAYDTTDSFGNYALSVNSGTYTQLRVRNTGASISGLPNIIEHTAATSVSVQSNTIVDVTLPNYIHLSGLVMYDSGDTVKNGSLTVKKWNNGAQSPPWDYDSSTATGAYSLYQEAGGIKIWVTPLGKEETAVEYTVLHDTVMNIIIPKQITVTGVVRTSSSATIANLTVAFESNGQQYQTTSQGNGTYSKNLTAGAYRIRLRNGCGMGANATIVPAVIEETIIESIVLSNDTTINLATPSYPTLSCTLKTTSLQSASFQLLSKRWNSGAQSPPWHLDSAVTNGVAQLLVGSGVNKIWLEPLTNCDFIALSFEINVTADTAIAISLSQGVTLSGVVYRSDSTTTAGILVALEQDASQWMDTTDSGGEFSLQMQPGTYRLRIRNTGAVIAGVPTTLEYTVADTIILSQSIQRLIRLPFFPTIQGIVVNSAGTVVPNVSILAKHWDNGCQQPPWAWDSTDVNGAYSLVCGSGTTMIWVTPPHGSNLGNFKFIETIDSNMTKNITIANQAQCITRLQPSVITRGENGTVQITGIGGSFLGKTITIDMGTGITVSNIRILSNITLTATLTIASDAQTGVRDVVVNTGIATLAGPRLVTITAPASAAVSLDGQGKTADTIIISDGTGTELIIPTGTPITFPAGGQQVISYVAPIPEGSEPTLANGELTDIARQLQPSGLEFGDTVTMVCQYTDQDVEGLSEANLTPYYYVESQTSGAIGDKITVTKRDTVANTLEFSIPHFSMFRIATVDNISAIATPQKPVSRSSTFLLNSTVINRGKDIRFYIQPSHSDAIVTLQIVDLKGRAVSTLVNGVIGSGVHTLTWFQPNKTIGRGVCILRLRIAGAVELREKIILIH